MCEFEVKITPWLLGDLSEAEALELEHHLATCQECQSVKAELELFLPTLQDSLSQDEFELPTAPLINTAKPHHQIFGRLSHWTLRHAALFVAGLTLFTTTMVLMHYHTTRPHPTDPTHTSIEFHKYKHELPPTLKNTTLPAEHTLHHELDLITETAPLTPATVVPPPPVTAPPHFPELPRLIPSDELAIQRKRDNTAPPVAPPEQPAVATRSLRKKRTPPDTAMPTALSPIAVGTSYPAELTETNNVSTNNLNNSATNTPPRK